MELNKIKEGSSFFLTPIPRIDDKIPRRSDYVFYNRHQEINRDISVLVVRAYAKKWNKQDLVICEPLSGSGIRSCRYVLETPTSIIYCNDLNPRAIEVTKKNINMLPRNLRTKFKIFSSECNFFLQMLNNKHITFDFVDIDPYGTPIPFVQSSLRLVTTRGLLAFTATDLASLAGLYPRALFAKYGISLFGDRIGNIHEIAARVLVTGIQHVGLTLNQSLIPIATIYYRHFIRSFLIRYRGVDRVLEQIGFINYCRKCQTRFQSLLENKNITCPVCDSHIIMRIGPLFLGLLQDTEYLSLMLKDKHLQELGTLKKIIRILTQMNDEASIQIPWSFDIPKLAKKIHLRAPSTIQVINELQKNGYDCCKTHYSGSTLKTNAQENEINQIIKLLSTSTHS